MGFVHLVSRQLDDQREVPDQVGPGGQGVVEYELAALGKGGCLHAVGDGLQRQSARLDPQLGLGRRVEAEQLEALQVRPSAEPAPLVGVPAQGGLDALVLVDDVVGAVLLVPGPLVAVFQPGLGALGIELVALDPDRDGVFHRAPTPCGKARRASGSRSGTAARPAPGARAGRER
ncbi:hypothetical protein D3C87_1639250 [compost metagenome]